MGEGIVHIAGPLLEGVQRCTRCGHVLVDYRDAMAPDGTPPLPGFGVQAWVEAEGGRLSVVNAVGPQWHNRWCEAAGQAPEARAAAEALVDDYERRISADLLERDWLIEQILAYGAAREAAVLNRAIGVIVESAISTGELWRATPGQVVTRLRALLAPTPTAGAAPGPGPARLDVNG